MAIDLRSAVFERLRRLTPAESAAERDRLIGEARGMLQRSNDGHLTADDEERFDQIEADIEFLAHTHQQRERALALYNSGSYESGTPFGDSNNRPKRRALEGAQFLTRDQSVSDWLRDNGTGEPSSQMIGGFDRYLRVS